MEMQNKVVVITGAAGYIGKASAKLFAKEGANLVLVDKKKEILDEAINEIGLKDGQFIIVEADVTKEEDVKKYVSKTIQQYGKIDALFNNAGIEGNVAYVLEDTVDNYEKVMSVNVTGVFLGLKYAIKEMLKQGFGSIINTASDAGISSAQGLGAYVASKHAVIGLTKTAASECADKGIRINSICPSSINSRLMNSLEKGSGDPTKARTEYTEKIPMKRYGEPSEVAEVVLFLASPRSSFVTGSAYYVDGGRLAK